MEKVRKITKTAHPHGEKYILFVISIYVVTRLFCHLHKHIASLALALHIE